VAHDDRRTILASQYVPKPSDVVRQLRQRELWRCDAVPRGLQALDGRAPAGAVGPRAVNEDDIRPITH
jgi:hypothetical protein